MKILSWLLAGLFGLLRPTTVAHAVFIHDNSATALIPIDESRQIIKEAAQMSAAMSMFRTKNMGTKTAKMPVLSALVTAGFVSGVSGTNRPGLKPTSSAAWENKYLIAEEIAVIVPIAEETLDDSQFDIWAEIRPQIVESIGAVVDAAVLYGVNKPASWTDDPIVTIARDAGNSFVRGSVGSQRLDVDISDTMSLVEADGFEVNGNIAGVQLRGALRGLRDENGQPIYINSVRSDDPGDRPMIYGTPTSFLKNGAWDTGEADLVTGDFTKAILGIREDIRYKILTEATIYDTDGTTVLYALAQRDMVALRAVIRLAYAVANPITRLNPNGSTRSPFAVLRPTGASA